MALANSPTWDFIAPPPLETVFGGASRVAPPRPLKLTEGERALLPSRALRFAEFLFHCNRITWQDCCDAVRWQRAQRPSVGQIAIEFGWLDHQQVATILRERVQAKAYRRAFCEYAVERGYLSEDQAAAIMGRQRRQQRRIGEYFVERGLLRRDEVESLLSEHRAHNARHARQR